jgi:hypothetical protein
VKKSLALLAVFVLFQTEVKSHGVPASPVKRGSFTSFAGCKASALAWTRTLELGGAKHIVELDDGYLASAEKRTVRLLCSRQK